MSKKTKAGKLNMADMAKLLNKKAGTNVAHDLTKANPTEVKEWISTGSRWLDSIICRGKLAGIPVGKVTEIAGLEATGKSYMAAQIAANAQKMGIGVVYFDSESAIDPTFLERTGCDLSNLLYVQASTVEFVLESIEELLGSGEKLLFIWDSLALTPSGKDVEGDFNPQSSMAVKPRILSKGMSKLTVPLANAQCTLLVLNQLKTNITSNIAEALTTPFFTPGGKAMIYAYSLRVWLTGRKAKASFVVDDKGFRIGSEVKAKLEKSRFGTAGRTCNFKILWGADIGVQDEESWLDAIKGSDALTNAGAWYTLKTKEGKEYKFQAKSWIEKLEDPEFKKAVFDVMDEEIIMKFDTRQGDASQYYEIEEKAE
tara:strand:+ start:7319 stop:8428 length:1110 start_codon:yes stop_codon:yes gene_type:complete